MHFWCIAEEFWCPSTDLNVGITVTIQFLQSLFSGDAIEKSREYWLKVGHNTLSVFVLRWAPENSYALSISQTVLHPLYFLSLQKYTWALSEQTLAWHSARSADQVWACFSLFQLILSHRILLNHPKSSENLPAEHPDCWYSPMPTPKKSGAYKNGQTPPIQTLLACSLVGFWTDKPDWCWFVVREKHCWLADKLWLKSTSEQTIWLWLWVS